MYSMLGEKSCVCIIVTCTCLSPTVRFNHSLCYDCALKLIFAIVRNFRCASIVKVKAKVKAE